MDSMSVSSVKNINPAVVKFNKYNNTNVPASDTDSFTPSFKQLKAKHAPAKNYAKAIVLSLLLGLSVLFGCKKPEIEPVHEQPQPTFPVMPEMPEEIKLFEEAEQYLSEHPEKVQEGLEFIFSLGIIDEEHQIEILKYSDGGKRFFVTSMIISNDAVREWYKGINP